MNIGEGNARGTVGKGAVMLAAAMGLVAGLATMGGCSTLRLNVRQADEGLTIVLPGIDGRGLPSETICRRLADEGVPTAIELFDWTSPAGPLINQTAMSRNRGVALQLADRIAEYRREFPGRPVYLVAHSGGTAIAVWAAEALPPGQRLDAVVLLASSLSPGYDLSGALAHTRRLVSFYSSRDTALLGAGCRTVGTMDRQFTEAAGKVGFDAAGGNLTQVPFDVSMERVGHNGSHFSYCSNGFVTAYVAPLLKSRSHPIGPAVAAGPPVR